MQVENGRTTAQDSPRMAAKAVVEGKGTPAEAVVATEVNTIEETNLK